MGDEQRRALVAMIEVAQFRPSMASCAGSSLISSSGSGRSSGSGSAPRRCRANCGPWAIANSRRARDITLNLKERSRFLKRVPARLAAIAREKRVAVDDIEIWFADEARIGQKNKITRRWAMRGTRPSAPRDQRTASTYIFGSICPFEGKGAALVLPRCDSEAMSPHLAEIAREIALGKHAFLLLDQAGWHLSGRLIVPENITHMPLPPKCPELNPVENIWELMRDN